MKAQHLLPYIAALFLLSACTGEGRRMQALLEQAEEMNRTDQPFLSDSIGKALVRHYDHWWHSRNLRMRAYYMLGCAYRDMDEAPAALHYYNVAAEQADTSSTDCDYSTLFRVYGQMATIYGRQNMPMESLKAWSAYSRYAFLAKDTTNGILGYVYMAGAYYAMDDTANVFKFTEIARRLYLKRGEKEDAARVFPTAIYVSLLNRDFPRARQYMDIFESESGLFDENGNIANGREHYYNSKGLYYKGTGKLDSAEYYFRSLLSFGYSLEGSEGLLSIYEQTKNADSIAKYAHAYEQSLMQWRGARQAEAITQSSAMYNYTRNQALAEQKTKEVQVSLYLVSFLLAVLCLILLLVRLFYKKIQQRQQQKQEQIQILSERYRSIQQNMEGQNQEAQLLKNILSKHSSAHSELDKGSPEPDIITLFKAMAHKGLNGRRPTQREWKRLTVTYKSHFPYMYSIIQLTQLSEQETCVCMLLSLDFSNSDLATLLSITPQAVNNAKQHANKKLFGQNNASTLTENLKKMKQFLVYK